VLQALQAPPLHDVPVPLACQAFRSPPLWRGDWREAMKTALQSGV
jgi:hypothetical protein